MATIIDGNWCGLFGWSGPRHPDATRLVRWMMASLIATGRFNCGSIVTFGAAFIGRAYVDSSFDKRATTSWISYEKWP